MTNIGTDGIIYFYTHQNLNKMSTGLSWEGQIYAAI